MFDFSNSRHLTITGSSLTNVQGHQFNTTVTNNVKFTAAVSLGEIFSTFELARKLVRILSDSQGSSREYQELILEIDYFSSTLEHLHQAVILSTRGLNPLQSSTGNAIKFALSKCQTLMNDFMKKIKIYQSGLQKGGWRSGWRDSWRKMGWAFLQVDVIELKNRLVEQKMTITTMISISNSCSIERVEQIAQKHELVARRHDITLTSIYASIGQLPMVLGHPWEGGLNDDRKPLWLIDVLGVKIPLPIELCANWEVFDGLLKLYFRNRAGQKYVENGDYDVTSHDDHQVIKPAMWDSRVKPGMIINMNIILRLLGLKYSHRCPSCQKVPPGITSSVGEVKCGFCQTSFWISESSIENVEEKGDIESTHGEARDVPALKRSKFQQPLIMEDDIRFIRRIHIISVSPLQTAQLSRRGVQWPENPIILSPPLKRKKGWFNRRGDQLWTNEGSYKPPAAGEEYPVEFDGYPEYGQGWMNEEGVRIDMRHRLIPKRPLKSALKRRPQFSKVDKE